jgi:hypothetical protein
MTEEQFAEAEMSFRETVQPGQGIRVTRSFVCAGKITQVMFHFPPGCAALVEVRLLKDEKPFYPIEGVLALDNATPVHYTDVEYREKEPLTVEILNRDAVNPHTPTVTVTIRYKKPWWDKSG